MEDPKQRLDKFKSSLVPITIEKQPQELKSLRSHISIKSAVSTGSAYDLKQPVKSYRFSDSTEHPLDIKSQLFLIDKDGELLTEEEIKAMAGFEKREYKKALNDMKKVNELK
jgi:hypothetical protein